MYQEGTGVQQNLDTAERLFLLSHKLNNKHCIDNLVSLYLLKNDPDRALVWHERSIQNKSSYAMSRDKHIRENIEQLSQKNKILGVLGNENKEQLEYFLDALQRINNYKPTYSISSDKRANFDLEILREYSIKKSSLTASKIIMATYYYHSAILLLENENFKVNDFIELMHEAYITEPLACRLPIELFEKVVDILEKAIQKDMNNKSDLDKYARYCYMNIKPNIHFVSKSIEKYPENNIFRSHRGCLYCFEENWNKAIKDFDHVYKSDPEFVENLYYRAPCLRYINGREQDSIEAYRKFLTKAAPDHRKIPECYYSLGLLEMTKKPLKEENVVQFYNKGLESEKDQLPCFLPYKSNMKPLLESSLNLILKNDCKKSIESSKSKSEESTLRDDIKKDFRRINLIIDFRKYCFEFKKLLSDSNDHTFFNTLKPAKEQLISNSLIGLKKILFKDMDFTKDHIVKDHVLTVTNIDIVHIGKFSTLLIVQD